MSELKNSSEDKAVFEFCPYKSILSKVIQKLNYIIEDSNDFWIFVQKYTNIEIKKSAMNKSKLTNEKTTVLKYDVKYVVNSEIKLSDREMYSCLSIDKNHILRKHFSKFILLIGLYTNFKQKEKFNALKKIRDTQKNLPVMNFRDKILNTIQNEKVVIIAGDTGCGKSTQIPQFLWQAGYNRIACTQPRRIACISLSKRVAYETLTQYTSEVGFQIRFEKHRNRETKVLFITEGLLLRQASGEDMLTNYDVIVLDEIHERHLHGDFLLGITKCLLHQREDLKLVLMSATINIELFSNYFGDTAKIITIPGRLFPIATQYFPILNLENDQDKFDPSPYIRILHLIDQKYSKTESGDVLIFLSGTKEITAVVDAAKLYNEKSNSWCILPLHSSLSLKEQDMVFDYPPEGYRKCVVCTNIAETSITIDGIRFVIDSGKVKEMSYDPICKLHRLKEFWISKASAEQRKGRAGRTGPGVCFRMFSENDYMALTEYTTPEIQRVPLDSVFLQMIAMGLPNVRTFPFIEPPDLTAIDNSLTALKLHGVITSSEKLTDIGKTLAKLPVDILIGKMLIMGSLFHQVEPVLSLASILSVQSPFTNRAFRDLEMQEARKELESDHGDPITLLNIVREWLCIKQEETQERGVSSSKSRKWCKKRGLEEQRFYEMTKLRSQFKDLLVDCNLINKDCSAYKSNEEMSSAERSVRHGELKQLRKLKREHETEYSKKSKILKADAMEIEFYDVEEEDTTTDIRDIEFRLRNNPLQVQDLLENTTATSYKDLMMLKLIYCSALYPQVAIPDEFNASKTTKEQLFHTSEKSFVSLHPNSFFSFNVHVLQLEESDIVQAPPNFHSKLPISSKHQVLFYMSLLETSKVYLVNTLRMPAAQSILLFAQNIHTNHNFTRFVCDDWLEIKMISSLVGEKVIMKICKIRELWENLLSSRLEGTNVGKLDELIVNQILEVMRADMFYTVRRLLPADRKLLFNNLSNKFAITCSDNPFSDKFSIVKNENCGGFYLTNFLTYNSLVENEELETDEKWKCDQCEIESNMRPLERLQHIKMHQDSKSPDDNVCVNDSMKLNKPNTKLYKCNICQKKLYLTPTEILKHCKEHKKI